MGGSKSSKTNRILFVLRIDTLGLGKMDQRRLVRRNRGVLSDPGFDVENQRRYPWARLICRKERTKRFDPETARAPNRLAELEVRNGWERVRRERHQSLPRCRMV